MGEHPNKHNMARKLKKGWTIDLNTVAEMWSTPNTPTGGRSVDAETVENRGATEKGKRQVGLESEARHWMTPRGTDGEKGGPNQRGSKGDLMLPSQAAQWGTPSARDWKDERASEATYTKNARPLNEQALRWPLPTSSLPPAPETGTAGLMCWCGSPGCGQASHKRRLNPLFSAWLMGWPLHWANTEPTSCAASETESFLHVWRTHLSLLQSSTGSEPSGQMDLFNSPTEERLSL